jgi:hypothetical protein
MPKQVCHRFWSQSSLNSGRLEHLMPVASRVPQGVAWDDEFTGLAGWAEVMGDSLKEGQPAPLSSRMIGKPLFHRRTLAPEASLLPPVIKGESRESTGSDFESFD